MNKRVIKEEKARKNTLYGKILLRLTIPLFLLATLISAYQLSNEMMNLNRFNILKAKFSFQSLFDDLKKATGSDDLAPAELEKEITRLSAFYQLRDFSLYDLSEAEVLHGDQAEAPRLQKAGEILFKKSPDDYKVTLDKQSQLIVAYFPLKNTDQSHTYVAKASLALFEFKEVLSNAQRSLFVLWGFILLTGFAIAQGLAGSIVKPIRTLSQATRDVTKGNLGKHVEIHTGDEIENLAETFNRMSDSLKDMQQRAVDANPLTGLPGNNGIMNELQKRIYEKQKFVVFHTDLDRFKLFNDHHGLSKGDIAIKKTAELLLDVVKSFKADDYVGHQGGDDFVIITRPNRAEQIGQAICTRFKQDVVAAVYSKEDFERGYTMALDRRHFNETGEEKMMKFPLLGISLAGVSNAKKDFADHFDCMNAAAKVKKEVKKNVESSYMIVE